MRQGSLLAPAVGTLGMGGGSFQLPGVIERGLQGNTGNQCMAGARQVPRLTSSLGSGSENLTRLGRAGADALGKAVRKFGL